MILSLFITLSLISLFLLVAGRFFQDQDYGIFFYISGFLIIFFTGTIAAFTGITYVDGSTTLETPVYSNGEIVETTLVTVNNYSSLSSTLNLLITLVYILVGIGGVGTVISNLQEKRWKATEDFE